MFKNPYNSKIVDQLEMLDRQKIKRDADLFDVPQSSGIAFRKIGGNAYGNQDAYFLEQGFEPLNHVPLKVSVSGKGKPVLEYNKDPEREEMLGCGYTGGATPFENWIKVSKNPVVQKVVPMMLGFGVMDKDCSCEREIGGAKRGRPKKNVMQEQPQQLEQPMMENMQPQVRKRGRPKKGGFNPLGALFAPMTMGLSMLGSGESGGAKKLKQQKMKGGFSLSDLPTPTQFASPLTMQNPLGLVASVLGDKSPIGKVVNTIAQPWSLLGLGESGGRRKRGMKKGKMMKPKQGITVSTNSLQPQYQAQMKGVGGAKVNLSSKENPDNMQWSSMAGMGKKKRPMTGGRKRYQDALNQVRQQTGLSLKDAMKYMKENNLYKK